MEETIYDLCIVGAGIFGSVAARYASANPNLKICLVGLDEPTEDEYHERDIFSSHYDEGRIVKVMFPSPAFQKLSRASVNKLRDLKKLSGVQFYNPVGFLGIGRKDCKFMKRLEDISDSVGTQLTKIQDEQHFNKIFPFLKVADDEYGLLDATGAGIVSARKMLEAEMKVAREQGCHILFDTVTAVELLHNNLHSVETGRHWKIKTKRVLITTGAFVNVNNFKVLPPLEMYVYKEMAAMVRIPHSEAERLSSMTGIIHKRDDDDVGFYILPPVLYPDGRYYLKVGSMLYQTGAGLQTKEEIKHWFLSEEKPGETEAMSKILFELLPGLNSDGIFRKVCVTSETITDFPYVDQVTPTVTVAVVGNGWGVTIAEEIGRLAANLSLTGTWDSDIPKSLFEIVYKKEKM